MCNWPFTKHTCDMDRIETENFDRRFVIWSLGMLVLFTLLLVMVVLSKL